MPNILTMHDVPCPLCGSENNTPVFTSPDWTGTAAGDFRLVRCRACQHRYLNPMPVDESLADCYPQDYGPHQRAIGRPATHGGTGQLNRSQPPKIPWYLSSWVRSIPGPLAYYRWVTDTKSVWVPSEDGAGRRALELGCSSGWFLAQLRNRGWSPVGVDLVEGPLTKARDAGFEVHHGTLDSVQFDAECFDAVFAWMVIEHVPRPKETLRAIHSVLKPGGHFAFSIPNVASWESRLFGRHWRGYDLPRHPQHFTPRVIRTLLNDEGFEVKAISHQPSFLYWIGSAGSWLRETFPNWSLGATLMEQYENQPPLWSYLLLGPLGSLNALMHQSGRLTIIASRKS
ncbi:MAG: class I SAM-dependent methyltransferase [Planctomycetaceae bacterium]|nr:class I SAM-dependent methyltransferase [Planctomycetaceae bacterium]